MYSNGGGVTLTGFGVAPIFLSTFNGAPNVWFNGASNSGANLYNANSSPVNVNVLAIW